MPRCYRDCFWIFSWMGVLALVSAAGGDEKLAAKVDVIEKKEGFLFQEGEKKILFYQQKTKSLEGKYARANYVHPLWDLDGEVLTEDFPADHLHHRGVFWAWHQVWVGEKRAGDPWVCKDFSWDVEKTKILPQRSESDRSAALMAQVLWKSPQVVDDQGEMKPLLRETVVIRAFPQQKNSRTIDFQIRLEALVERLRIGGSEDDKGYGGFSVRIRLPDGLQFVGEKGDVEPIRTAVSAGPWLDFSGDYFGRSQVSGLAILAHRSLPVFPPAWILRRKGSMQNAVYPGRRAVTLQPGKPLALRYRLVVHRGDAQAAEIADLSDGYQKEE